MSKIRVDLEKRVDNFGKTFYVGKLKGPYLIDCNEKTSGGACFLVFISEDGQEELHIAAIDKNQKINKIKKPQVYKTIKKDKK